MSPPVMLSPTSHAVESSSQALAALKLKQGDTLRLYAAGALEKVEEVKFRSAPGQKFQVTVPSMRAAGSTEWVKNILELTADENGEVQLKIQVREGVRHYEGAAGAISARQAEYTEAELSELQSSHDVDSSAAQAPKPSEESSDISISQLNVKFSEDVDTVTPEIRHFRQNSAVSDLLALSKAGQPGLYRGFFHGVAASGVGSGLQAQRAQVQEEQKKEEEKKESESIDRQAACSVPVLSESAQDDPVQDPIVQQVEVRLEEQVQADEEPAQNSEQNSASLQGGGDVVSADEADEEFFDAVSVTSSHQEDTVQEDIGIVEEQEQEEQSLKGESSVRSTVTQASPMLQPEIIEPQSERTIVSDEPQEISAHDELQEKSVPVQDALEETSVQETSVQDEQLVSDHAESSSSDASLSKESAPKEQKSFAQILSPLGGIRPEALEQKSNPTVPLAAFEKSVSPSVSSSSEVAPKSSPSRVSLSAPLQSPTQKPSAIDRFLGRG
jgi:hypothetical protein